MSGREHSRYWLVICCTIVLLLIGFASMPAAAQTKPEGKNMDLVGYNDLQGRSAYQPTIHKQGNRYIAYIGHHGGSAMNPLTGKMEDNGTSIVDVTDPTQSEIFGAHSRRSAHSRPGRNRRRADGARVRRQRTPARGQEKSVFAAHHGHRRARNVGRDRSREPDALDRRRKRPARYAQELVGVRYRHRVPGFRRARLARQAHDAGL